MRSTWMVGRSGARTTTFAPTGGAADGLLPGPWSVRAVVRDRRVGAPKPGEALQPPAERLREASRSASSLRRASPESRARSARSRASARWDTSPPT